MVIKYKLSEVAKDLNLQNKDVIDLLLQYNDTPKKSVTTLTDEELNIVFDHFTQKNQVADFNAYFNASAPSKPAEEKPAPKAEKPQPKAAEKPQPKAEEKPAAKAPEKAQQPKQPDRRPENGKQQRPQNNASGRDQKPAQKSDRPFGNGPKNQNGQNKQFNNSQKPFNSKNGNQPSGNKPNKPAESASERALKQANAPAPKQQNEQFNFPDRTKKQKTEKVDQPKKEIVTRYVDTRAAEVDLDKYNERYEQIAPASRMNNDNMRRKQKINQKSQQRGRQQSQKRETEAQKLQRLALERARKQQLKVMIPDEIVVSELATRLKVTVSEVIKRLMLLGVMASMNEVIDFDTASLVAEELGAKVEHEVIVTIEERLIDDSEDDTDNLEPRSPIVVVMGHVDHGKTSLLDKIRNANVTATEAGGITQHIGAYQVKVNDQVITFLDTPGHEAFTAMRARGASVTDVAILVVAADDGIMPQTVEAINHAKAAGVSIIVAINKIDKVGANPDRVLQELTEYELVPEQWGGDTVCCPVSALTGEGIDNLLEMVCLVSDMRELKANPNRSAKGTVIEARLDKGRGPVATLLVQNGTLHSSDVIIAGTTVGRIRVMTNDRGMEVSEAGPSMPVEITGLDEVPSAGDVFNAVADERLARTLVEQRKHDLKEKEFQSYQKVTLDNLFSQIEQGEMKELDIVVKADVQGSVEAVKQSLEKLSNDEVRVRVIHGGVGAISKSDVMLANASNAIIIGFNVRPDPVARQSAEEEKVEMRTYRIIYDAIDDVTQAMKGMLAPKFRDVELGRIEVRQVYKISNVGTVAGCYVTEGKVTRAAMIRVVRDGIVIFEDQIDSLRRFKDDVREVAQGYECGIGLVKFNDVKEGDVFEAYIVEEYRD